MFLIAGSKAVPKVASGSPVPILIGALLAISLALGVTWYQSREWWGHYTKDHVLKRAMGAGSSVSMGVFIGVLVLMGLFGTPFYKCPPVDRLFGFARSMLAAPAPSPTMPDMREMYFWIHVVIAGAATTAVVAMIAASACKMLAAHLKPLKALS